MSFLWKRSFSWLYSIISFTHEFDHEGIGVFSPLASPLYGVFGGFISPGCADLIMGHRKVVSSRH